MRFKRAALCAAIAAALVVAPVSAASAKSWSEKVGGGDWQHGVESGRAFSNYHHGTKSHTATACNGSSFGEKCKQVLAVKNQWANASIAASLSGNVAYWNTL